MIIPPKHAAVNWAEGMTVSHHHFNDTENFIIDSLRDVASVPVNNYNFRLLPPLKGEGARLSNYEVTKTATNQVQIRISHCQAITPGGVRISIAGDGGATSGFSQSIDLNSQQKGDKPGSALSGVQEQFYVILVVNPLREIHPGLRIPRRSPFGNHFLSLK